MNAKLKQNIMKLLQIFTEYEFVIKTDSARLKMASN